MLTKHSETLDAITETLSGIANKTTLIHKDTTAIRQDTKTILTHVNTVQLEGISSEVVKACMAASLVEEGTCLIRSELSSAFRDYRQDQHKDIYDMKKASILNTNRSAGTFLIEMLSLMGFEGYHHYHYGRKDVIVGWQVNEEVRNKLAKGRGKRGGKK